MEYYNDVILRYTVTAFDKPCIDRRSFNHNEFRRKAVQKGFNKKNPITSAVSLINIAHNT